MGPFDGGKFLFALPLSIYMRIKLPIMGFVQRRFFCLLNKGNRDNDWEMYSQSMSDNCDDWCKIWNSKHLWTQVVVFDDKYFVIKIG